MAYDPDPSYREKTRGLRWYSVVAFLAVMVLLIINIQAMRDNTRAENRRADAAEAQLVIQERMAQLMDSRTREKQAAGRGLASATCLLPIEIQGTRTAT